MCVNGAGKWLRSAAVAASLLLAPVGFAGAQGTLNSEDLTAIREMISDQLAAFVADDGERAFSHASPGIRGLFGNAAAFMAMVRGGYPSVYRAQRVRRSRISSRRMARRRSRSWWSTPTACRCWPCTT